MSTVSPCGSMHSTVLHLDPKTEAPLCERLVSPSLSGAQSVHRPSRYLYPSFVRSLHSDAALGGHACRSTSPVHGAPPFTGLARTALCLVRFRTEHERHCVHGPKSVVTQSSTHAKRHGLSVGGRRSNDSHGSVFDREPENDDDDDDDTCAEPLDW